MMKRSIPNGSTNTAPREPGFAVWITGLPGSGKSTITRSLARKLAARGLDVAVLESDTLRRAIMPDAGYDERDRAVFYHAMVWIGELLTRHGVPVIFDATANRRAYRDHARARIARFIEVHVDCPLAVCLERDPKGIYRQGREGKSRTVPGLQSAYEAPMSPDVVVSGAAEVPDLAADRIIAGMSERGYLTPRREED